jgi:hypothetical protein
MKRKASTPIDFRGARGLDKSVIRALVQESAWVGTHENVFVLGRRLVRSHLRDALH